jgi:hypothetical protein
MFFVKKSFNNLQIKFSNVSIISHPRFLVGSVLLIFSFSVLCLSLFCVLCPMLSVSLEFAPVLSSGVSCCSICPIMCLYVLSSVLWFPLRLPHKKRCLARVCHSCYLCLFANSVKYVLTIWVAMRGSYKRQWLLTFREHLCSHWFYGGIRVAHLFCVLLLYDFTFLVPCCDVRYDFRIETMFGSFFTSRCL